MPQGYGIFQNGKKLAEEKAVLAKLPPPSTTGAIDGDTLVSSAETAVRALAKQNGVTLPESSATEQSSSSNRDRAVLAGGVILLAVLALAVRFLLGRRRKAADAA